MVQTAGLVFLGVGWALHSPGFSEPMVYDSQEWIANKARIFASHEPLKVLAIFPVRPLFMLSLYANYLWAGMDPNYFRAVNVAIVALAGMLLVLLSSLVFQIPGSQIEGSRRARQAVVVFLGMWFVAHPLQSFVVLYDWQRAASMACLFYFGGFTLWPSMRAWRSNPLTQTFSTLPASWRLLRCARNDNLRLLAG